MSKIFSMKFTQNTVWQEIPCTSLCHNFQQNFNSLYSNNWLILRQHLLGAGEVDFSNSPSAVSAKAWITDETDFCLFPQTNKQTEHG